MLHLIYVIAFTIIALIAIANLVRSLVSLSIDSQRGFSVPRRSPLAASPTPVPHPELLDDNGNPINEPLLVMRSMTVEDARQRLDALYNSSPGGNMDKPEEI
ncbi:MAG TPA: DUF2973 domain-containing protein [Cyanobacteria bacterium UBA11149]|nr:DUF2973 domain-containing protein [Cyanobacteria bacterium UBA11367]HBE60750.1 DUF2973 domain-containing protein [Cyanobacteria bacterium UBA11366]HBK66828.1 DUF2973 domain-containing protein [Cyanobacteria bacterium UBA11166]HBR72819.1 DUF2973 domain-containing protein [Cyanobacteria bacterium UBA11159]HBS68228.1 DUF2973 domain-containing protein [Cyanobacteria bacterium UBA11153]HBW89000.1 DUF2973 domain-containing protein [Cyanobacteria bacterium UBA11149]HCA94985.1 DUF2973 domain-conta